MNDTLNRIPNEIGIRRWHSSIPEQGDNYVLEGLDATIDGDTLEITRGTFHFIDGDEVVLVDTGPRMGSDALDLPDSGTAGVWYDIEPNAYVVGTDPGGATFQVATVDVDAGTVTLENRRPDVKRGSVESDLLTTENLLVGPGEWLSRYPLTGWRRLPRP